MFAALRAELGACWTAARRVERIRVTESALPGSMVATPIVEDEQREHVQLINAVWGPYEVLVHPDDWRELAEEGLAKIVEVNMRLDGVDEDEIAAVRDRILDDPDGCRFYGIPIVSD